MVVRDRASGRWMLPGGRVGRRERSKRGAARELFEESGHRPGSPLRLVDRRGGTSLYETDLRRHSHAGRNRRFHRRSTPRETADYGFLDPTRSRLVVTDFPAAARTPTPSPSGAAPSPTCAPLGPRRSSGCRRLHRHCDANPGACFGEGFVEMRRKACGR